MSSPYAESLARAIAYSSALRCDDHRFNQDLEVSEVTTKTFPAGSCRRYTEVV